LNEHRQARIPATGNISGVEESSPPDNVSRQPLACVAGIDLERAGKVESDLQLTIRRLFDVLGEQLAPARWRNWPD